MTSDKPPASPEAPLAETPPLSELEPHVITAALRQSLQRCFEHARKLTSQERYDYDYANTLLTECVVKDPGNLVYVEAFLDNLQAKYNHNKKGARLKGFGGRSSFKKAVGKQDWAEALGLGPELLKTNPWDVAVLRPMARACEAYGYNEVELRYLKNALDANPKDIEVNRHCAFSLARMGQFDQAIACWHRIAEQRKNDPEAMEMISQLTVERARDRSGAATDQPARSVAATRPKPAPPGPQPGLPFPQAGSQGTAPSAAAHERAPANGHAPAEETEQASETPPPPKRGEIQLTPRQKLEHAIQEDPTNVEHYVSLADLLLSEGRYGNALSTLNKALAVSGKEPRIVALMEEAQLAQAKEQLAIAEKRATKDPSEKTRRLVKQLRADLNRRELAVYARRCDENPGDLELRFELGLRLKRAGNCEEAIKSFEQAQQEPDLDASAKIEMGECWQVLKRYKEALRVYQAAAEVADELLLPDEQKLALYRAGVLATGLRKLDVAEACLKQLHSLDPQYKDLPARLDKLKKIRENG